MTDVSIRSSIFIHSFSRYTGQQNTGAEKGKGRLNITFFDEITCKQSVWRKEISYFRCVRALLSSVRGCSLRKLGPASSVEQ